MLCDKTIFQFVIVLYSDSVLFTSNYGYLKASSWLEEQVKPYHVHVTQTSSNTLLHVSVTVKNVILLYCFSCKVGSLVGLFLREALFLTMTRKKMHGKDARAASKYLCVKYRVRKSLSSTWAGNLITITSQAAIHFMLQDIITHAYASGCVFIFGNFYVPGLIFIWKEQTCVFTVKYMIRLIK